MDPAERLREGERRLAIKYGGEHPPRSFDGEDLQSDDPADAEHWVGVYVELIQFMETLIESASSVPSGRFPTGGAPTADGLHGLRLQAQILELHLTYWTERLNGLCGHAGPDQERPG